MTGKKHKAPAKRSRPTPATVGEAPRPADLPAPLTMVGSGKKANRASAGRSSSKPPVAAAASTILANPDHSQGSARATALADAVQAVLHSANDAGSPATRSKTKPRLKRPGLADPPATPVTPDSVSAEPSPAPTTGVEDTPALPEQIAPAAPAPLEASPPASPEGDVPAESARRETAPAPSPAQAGGPDLDALAQNMGQWLEQSGKLTAAYLKPEEERARPGPYTQEVSDAVRTLGQVAEHWLLDPARMIQAQASLSTQFLGLWSSSLQRLTARTTDAKPAEPPPRPTDKRFTDAEWYANPVFDFVRKAYLLGTDWASQLVEGADSLDEPTRDKARFYLRQVSSALSPSNFVATNPELLRETIKQNGGNLVRGLTMLAEDIAAGKGDLKIRQTDASKFELGVNMALTPGSVVFRNDLIELLQYAPSTATVFRRPLLIVPPWINKFYVLDLNPEKSFVRWAVAQGLTVFVVSWVNPDARHADKGFEAYMREGIFEALDAVEAATGERDVTTIGYCVGGTLLAVALAHMAARGETRVSSATLFTTQVDFGHAGDLKIFADEAQIRAVEAQMKETGYLEGGKMAQAFNMLRPDELIWSYVVNNYLKGKEPMPFDLLAWNADSTRMPAANHSFYLRNCYLENKLTRGQMVVGGERLDLRKVTIPIYNLATRDDHIAPARSVFEGSRAFGGPVRFVLAGSGHIAGVVSPPAKAKYVYALGPAPEGEFQAWLDAAVDQPGSWWTDWIAWLSAQAPERVPAREPGDGRLAILGDAPGTYVRVRA